MKQRLSSICGIGSVLTGALMCASCMGSYQIEGNVDGHGYDGHVMSLVEYTQQGFQVLDSCMVNHGAFSMDGATDTVRFVMLCKDYVPVIPMYLEKGRTKVRLSPTEMVAHGTRQNNLFYSFLQEKNEIDNRFDDMQQKMQQLYQDDVVDRQEIQAIRDSISSIIAECEDLIFGFISSNFNEQAAVGAFLMLTFGPTNGNIPPLVRRIVDVAPDKFLKNSAVDQYLKSVGYSR